MSGKTNIQEIRDWINWACEAVETYGQTGVEPVLEALTEVETQLREYEHALGTRSHLLPDDMVCECFDLTGSRQVRVYEMCTRCQALMLSDDSLELRTRLSNAAQDSFHKMTQSKGNQEYQARHWGRYHAFHDAIRMLDGNEVENV